MSKHRVLIVGSGFAGFCLARALDRHLTASGPLEATLLSPSVACTFSPLLAGVIAGWVEPWQLKIPLRPALRRVKLVVGRAVQLDLSGGRVAFEGPGVQTGCESGFLHFDELVLACGTTTDHRGVPGALEGTLGFRTLDDAVRIRNRVAELLEAASGEDSARRRRAICSIVVAGDDARACAAALEVSRRLRRISPMFPRIEPGEARVLLAGSDELPCSSWGPEAASQVRALLERSGIETSGPSSLERVGHDHVLVRRGPELTRVEARTVLWTHADAPVLAVARWAGAPLERGRLKIDEMLRVVGTENVHALGECALSLVHREHGSTPASVMRQASWLAESLNARARGSAPRAIASRPWLDPVLLDRAHGLARAGQRTRFGRIPAYLARRVLLSAMPGVRRWLAVASAWAVQGHLPSAQGDPSRLQPAQEPLYLTPPPAALIHPGGAVPGFPDREHPTSAVL